MEENFEYGASILYSKNRAPAQKMELKHWRELSKRCQTKSTQICQIIGRPVQLARGYNQKEEIPMIQGSHAEAIKFGYDFSVVMQEHYNPKTFEILTKIEQLDTIWRAE